MLVVETLRRAIADGSTGAGRAIRMTMLASRTQLPMGTLTEILQQLAEDGLVQNDSAASFRVPTPSRRDVVETYTARGLLGSAIVRRLAAPGRSLDPRVELVFDALLHGAASGDIGATDTLDLDLQDKLARSADMPRIEPMFFRLSLQLRLFVQLMGLDYSYPVAGIVEDDSRILEAIRAHDAAAAIEAWRAKVDNCVGYMMRHLDGTSTRGH